MNWKSMKNALYSAAESGNGVTLILSTGEEFISYQKIVQQSNKICNVLEKNNIVKNSEIIIKCNDLKNFLYAYWACIIGKYIAVPIDTRETEYKNRMDQDIVDILHKPILLCDQENEVLKEIEKVEKVFFVPEIITSDMPDSSAIEQDEEDDQKRIAYVQFSSGSTGSVKGVALTEKNIMANVYSMSRSLGITGDDTVLSWQPLTHCFGLTTFHLLPTLLGSSHYLIPTEIFMKNPLLWMEKIDEHRASVLGAIPFALKHFLDFYIPSASKYSWDLSCVKKIVVGGEQVNKNIIDKFADALEPSGLDKNIISAAYGLAEATTMVCASATGNNINEYRIDTCEMEIGEKVNLCEYENGSSFLCNGHSLYGVEIKICDERGEELPPNHFGRILVTGNNVITHYFRNQEMDEQAFFGNWLDTGDIGFISENGLVITGRSKELVVCNGKKYSCIALEDYIKKVIDDNVTNVVVVSVGDDKNGNEKIIAFCECILNLSDYVSRDRFLRMKERIQRYVMEVTGLYVDVVIPIDTIPKTYSGKTRRRELINMYIKGKFDSIKTLLEDSESTDMKNAKRNNGELTRSQIIDLIVSKIYETFNIKITDYNRPFRDYGIISVNVPTFNMAMENELGIEIGVTAVFAYPTINKYADMLCKRLNNKKGDSQMVENIVDETNKLAIVGMSCRFPAGANSPEDFWNVLINGKDGIIDIPEDRWELERFYSEDENASGKMYCKKTGFLETPIDEFDARLFNISPKEAVAMDPQQRLLLELTWEAFENADMNIDDYNGSDTGVYIGISSNEYALAHLFSGDLSTVDAYSLTGTAFSVACGRISYTFGFEGPCISVDTACSSGLSAFHLACNALKSKETDLAVVAGVNLILSPTNSVGFSKLHATAVDGYSKSFDASANGYGRGEGGGALLIKRFDDAMRDGDNIFGVICATGINQDGKSNGLTAPNGESQAKLIRKTLKKANLVPADIDYMEMHGTGTKLGDPIEVNAVADTYGTGHDKDNMFYIGSVKSNIGHLEPASGMASIIKVLLSMKNEVIPANLHFNMPNPLIDWNSMPIRVVDKNLPWKKQDKLRRAAVSGFGFGGSNAHLILEEPPRLDEIRDNEKEGIEYVLKISAKQASSLKKYINKYITYFENQCTDEDFPSAVYSANRGRADFDYRFAVIASSRKEMLESMKAYINNEEPENVYCNVDWDESRRKNKKLVFMYTGQGSQYLNMGRLLYDTNTAFRKAIESCDKIFRPYILKSIIELIYSENGNSEEIKKTEYAQPLLFAIEYALACMWKEMGVEPDIVVGHSIGEYAAAVAAGVMELEHAAKLVSIRGRLMGSAPGKGGMAAVYADIDTVRDMIKKFGNKVSIAACNAKELCTISGEIVAVDEVKEYAESIGIKCKNLVVSHGFHSDLMSPILGDFMQIAKEISYKAPKIRFMSALTTREFDENGLPDAAYWTEHIRGTVNFYDAISNIAKNDDCVFIEIGANRVLSGLCHLIFGDEVPAEGTLNLKVKDAKQVACAISTLYINGINVDWSNVEFHSVKKWKKLQVPTYPYEKSRYWRNLVFEKNNAFDASDSDFHKILGQRIESKNLKNTTIFQRKFRADEPFFMGEHIIFGTAISPAASHISMLLSAVKVLKNPASCTLQAVELRTPLAVVEGEERIVQVCLEEVEHDTLNFEIISKECETEAEWVIHAKGRVVVSDSFVEGNDQIDIEELKNLPSDNIEPEEGVYKMMKESGFDLGIGFRRIIKSTCTPGGSVCHIVPKTDIKDYESYEVYPGVIDSVLQTQLCTLLEELNTRNNGKAESDRKTIIPYYLGNVSYNYRDFDELWVKGNSNVGNEVVYSSLEAYNSLGEVILKMSDTMANMTERSALLRDLKSNRNQLLYHDEWVHEKENNSSRDNENIHYIIVSDNEKTVEKIEQGLIEQNVANSNISSILLEKNDEEFFNDGEWIKKQVIDKIADKEAKILYCPGLEADMEKINAVEMNNHFTKVLYWIVRAIADAELSEKVKIKTLTMNVQSKESDNYINLKEASLWGLMKVISIEFPSVYDGIIDTDTLEGKMVYAELLKMSAEEVALKNGDRFVNRLVRLAQYKKKHTNSSSAIHIDENGSYLITGGTGSLGMVYAECLINKGAKNILLMARKEPKQEVAEKIEEYQNNGINVEVVLADICKKEDIINALGERIGQIRGIVHAAGCIVDKMIVDLTVDEYDAVMLPKTKGLWNLYEIFEKVNLDFVICLSSITSLLGNIGQSNYAAANGFMNICTSWMQKKGIPAYTMCWGPWLDGGMATTKEAIDKNLSNMGIRPFTSEVGAEMIMSFMEHPINNLMIADLNWEKFAANTYGQWQENFVDNLIEKKEEEKDESQLTVLNGMTMTERQTYLLNLLQIRCGKIMGFEHGQLPSANVGLKEQGADSLMIFSMRTAVNKLLHTNLDVTTFYNYPTLQMLTDYILNEVLYKDEVADNGDSGIEDALDELNKLIDA